MPAILGERVDFATLVKVYSHNDEERGYSPGEVIDTIKTPCCGNPEAVCTSHVERGNKTLRMQVRWLTPLTVGHSKKWENHEDAVALFVAFYIFWRVHCTIKTTPAVKAGLTDHRLEHRRAFGVDRGIKSHITAPQIST